MWLKLKCSLQTDNIAIHHGSKCRTIETGLSYSSRNNGVSETMQVLDSITIPQFISLIPTYRKRIREEAAWNCQLWLRIYKGPAGRVQIDIAIRSCRFSKPGLCASVCQSCRCASSTSSLGRAGACCCSVPMKLLTAACISLVFRATPGGRSALFYERLYMISTNWPLPDFSVKKERVADSNEPASPRFDHAYLQVYNSCLEPEIASARPARDAHVETPFVIPESKSPVKSIKIQKLIIKLGVAPAPRDEAVRRRSKLFLGG